MSPDFDKFPKNLRYILIFAVLFIIIMTMLTSASAGFVVLIAITGIAGIFFAFNTPINRIIEEKTSSTLTIDERILDVDKSAFKLIRKNYYGVAFFIIAISIAIFFILLFIAIEYNEGDIRLFIIPFAIPFIAYKNFKTKLYTVFMRQFARVNNFKFYKKDHFKDTHGSIFSRGHSKRIYNVVEGSFLDYPISVFNYNYTVGAGRNKKIYQNTIFSIRLNKNMPHLYLDNTSHNKALYVKKGFEIIDLESTRFNKEFRLFVKKGRHIPALQIFTPDVMAKLIDLPGRADIEFIGKNIYIYEDHLIGTKQELEETFEIAKYLVHNMDHVLRSMNYRDPDEKQWDLIDDKI
ncbi:MAG: hypothetical protein R3251_02405 [Candidatus Spechtbacterales bacterium]|nr:hypothetical protein [Candidatus Spechtbacterales bacterium]